MAATVIAGVPAVDAWHIHNAANEARAAAGGEYHPQSLDVHEFATVRRLTELIIPADDASGSAIEAGAPEFIDLIAANNEAIAAEIIGGLAWLNRTMEAKTGNRHFIDAPAADQSALLEIIAFRRNATPENAQGIAFFDWIRRLTVDAFYTSPVGTRDVGYQSNKETRSFEVPLTAIGNAVNQG